MVIDADDDLSAADRALIDATARAVATLMVGERASADAAVAADDALVADLLGREPGPRGAGRWWSPPRTSTCSPARS